MAIYFLVDNDSGDQVKVDVEIRSCSCRDFKENHMTYQHNDPRRMCKHLTEALAIERTWIGQGANSFLLGEAG